MCHAEAGGRCDYLDKALSIVEIAMGLILFIILIVLLLGAAPAWPYSRGWGYYPSGGIGLVLLIVLILLLTGNLGWR
jgi:hypothetical protein